MRVRAVNGSGKGTSVRRRCRANRAQELRTCGTQRKCRVHNHIGAVIGIAFSDLTLLGIVFDHVELR